MKNSGIYVIKNIINEKFYLGSSINLDKRKRAHFGDLKRNKHHSKYLQRSYNKYGKDSFIFEIIFNCYPEYCREYESIFLKQLRPEYNISLDAYAPMEGRKHSEESKAKFKLIHANDPKGKDHWNYGKKLSEETKEKQRLKKLGSKRPKETKEKMSETAKRINSISRIDRIKQYKKVIDNDGIIYESATIAANANNISPQTMCDILKGRHSKTRKKKWFKYYE